MLIIGSNPILGIASERISMMRSIISFLLQNAKSTQYDISFQYAVNSLDPRGRKCICHSGSIPAKYIEFSCFASLL